MGWATSPELSSQWHEKAQNNKEAAAITLHQDFIPSSEMQSTAPYLHVFAGDSPKADGAVSYIVSHNQCSLVKAKSRGCPFKEVDLATAKTHGFINKRKITCSKLCLSGTQVQVP